MSKTFNAELIVDVYAQFVIIVCSKFYDKYLRSSLSTKYMIFIIHSYHILENKKLTQLSKANTSGM